MLMVLSFYINIKYYFGKTFYADDEHILFARGSKLIVTVQILDIPLEVKLIGKVRNEPTCH